MAEIWRILGGLGLVFAGILLIPVFQLLVFPGQLLIAVFGTLVLLIWGFWLLFTTFMRYRWPDVLALKAELESMGLLAGKD